MEDYSGDMTAIPSFFIGVFGTPNILIRRRAYSRWSCYFLGPDPTSPPPGCTTSGTIGRRTARPFGWRTKPGTVGILPSGGNARPDGDIIPLPDHVTRYKERSW